MNVEDFMIKKDSLFVPFGICDQIEREIKTNRDYGKFFAIWINGHTGCGKSYPIMQTLAKLKIPAVRIQFTCETDKLELIGSTSLVQSEDGSTSITRFEDGPILTCMRLGLIAVLDEIDSADPMKIMCLQSILEGGDYYNKATGEVIKPHPNFGIIATANTKGEGDADARYNTTSVFNQAFLDRFHPILTQDYPPKDIEKEILLRNLRKYNKGGKKFDTKENVEFINKLLKFAKDNRKQFAEGAIDALVSTRKMVQIISSLIVCQDMDNPQNSAVELAMNRYDPEIRDGMMKYWEALGDPEKEKQYQVENEPKDDIDIPF